MAMPAVVTVALVPVMVRAAIPMAMAGPMVRSTVMPLVSVTVRPGMGRRNTPRRLLHKVHGLAAGRISRAMACPIPGMPRWYIHIDGSTGDMDCRRGHHHRLRIEQGRRPPTADVHASIYTGSDLPSHCRAHIALRRCSGRNSPQQAQPREGNKQSFRMHGSLHSFKNRIHHWMGWSIKPLHRAAATRVCSKSGAPGTGISHKRCKRLFAVSQALALHPSVQWSSLWAGCGVWPCRAPGCTPRLAVRRLLPLGSKFFNGTLLFAVVFLAPVPLVCPLARCM